MRGRGAEVLTHLFHVHQCGCSDRCLIYVARRTRAALVFIAMRISCIFIGTLTVLASSALQLGQPASRTPVLAQSLSPAADSYSSPCLCLCADIESWLLTLLSAGHSRLPWCVHCCLPLQLVIWVGRVPIYFLCLIWCSRPQ